MDKPVRKLAAIMFTDIVGYSAMMQKDEVVTSRLRNRHREIFKKLTKRYEGDIIQYFGDGTLSIYPTATAAVECAINLQKELKGNPPVPLRIGIHTGEITYGKEDAHGDGVNIAARIEAVSLPGSVFISAKVYDDIKNHPWIKAKSLGNFQLKNIQNKLELYAITNEGITVPDDEPRKKAYTQPPKTKKQKKEDIEKLGRKNKYLAGGLGVGLGMFGIHRFYLGDQAGGAGYLVMSCLSLFIVPAMSKFIPVIAIIAFVDGMSLMFMTRKRFDAKYNQSEMEEEEANEASATTSDNYTQNQYEQYFEKGITEYQEYDYMEAIQYLSKAISIKYDEPEAHFLLACCYSMLENAEKAFDHLDTAIGFRLEHKERIKTTDDLSFLRIQPEYEAFVKNNYRIPTTPSTPQPDLLEQLNKLQELRNNGVLTEEEFLQQKEKLKLDRF